MSLDPTIFARNCARQALYLGVNLHYLLACAELRSGMDDVSAGAAVGPFAYDADTWRTECSDPSIDIVLDDNERTFWRSQCMGAALSGARALRAFLDRDGRYPTFSELYKEHWKIDPPAAVDIDAALAKTKPLVDPALADVSEQSNLKGGAVDTGKDKLPPIAEDVPGPNVGPGEELFVKKARWIMERLIDDFDLLDFQAAGILGNIGHECGGFHQMLEIRPKKGRGGFGWCQWTGTRRTKFEAYCKEQGVTPSSDGANYGYLKVELTGSHRIALDKLKVTATLSDAVKVFEEKFEKADPDTVNFPSRNRWATLALAPFRRTLPPGIASQISIDSELALVAQATFAGVKYWVVAERAENSGQMLIVQESGQKARIAKQDTTVFPLDGLGLPDPVLQELSRGQDGPPVASSSDDAHAGTDRAALVLAQAKACNHTLVTRNVKGTSNGALACAWAVNEVVRRALGAPIGGGLSTAKMADVLKAIHTRLTRDQVVAGSIIISPTQAKTGHVGIVGEIATRRGDTVIYSNSSRRGIFFDVYTLDTWEKYYVGRQGLDMLFYEA